MDEKNGIIIVGARVATERENPTLCPYSMGYYLGGSEVKNEYEVRGDVTAIFLKKKDGTILETIISTSKLDKVIRFAGTWYPSYSEKTQSYYAKGHIQGGTRKDRGKSVGLHRFILDTPKHLLVDHKNGITLDNTDENIINCTHLENNNNPNNKSKSGKNSSSGVRGIHWNKGRKKWRLYFSLRDKQEHFGYFETLDDAIKEKNRLLIEKSS